MNIKKLLPMFKVTRRELLGSYDREHRLDTVHVETNRAIATDSHRLLVAKFKQALDIPSTFYIGKIAAKILRAFKGEVALVDGKFQSEEFPIRIEDTVQAALPIDLERVAAMASGEPVATVDVDARLLSELLDVMDKMGGDDRNNCVTIRFYSKTQLLVLSAPLPDSDLESVTGYLMPLWDGEA